MFAVTLSSAAQKALRNARPEIRERLDAALKMLATTASPLGAQRLPISRDTWELSGEGFHLVYEVGLSVITVKSLATTAPRRTPKPA